MVEASTRGAIARGSGAWCARRDDDRRPRWRRASLARRQAAAVARRRFCHRRRAIATTVPSGRGSRRSRRRAARSRQHATVAVASLRTRQLRRSGSEYYQPSELIGIVHRLALALLEAPPVGLLPASPAHQAALLLSGGRDLGGRVDPDARHASLLPRPPERARPARRRLHRRVAGGRRRIDADRALADLLDAASGRLVVVVNPAAGAAARAALDTAYLMRPLSLATCATRTRRRCREAGRSAALLAPTSGACSSTPTAAAAGAGPANSTPSRTTRRSRRSVATR